MFPRWTTGRIIWLGKANHLRSRLAHNGENDPVTMQRADQSIGWQRNEIIKQLYSRYEHNSLIKWMDSIKKVMGLKDLTKVGMDV